MYPIIFPKSTTNGVPHPPHISRRPLQSPPSNSTAHSAIQFHQYHCLLSSLMPKPELAGKNAYKLLGISETSSLAEIKARFRKLAKETVNGENIPGYDSPLSRDIFSIPTPTSLNHTTIPPLHINSFESSMLMRYS
ncbi:hypothetical protein RHSIM_Rhsim08G0100500 [Rhododendron simsii]|uniref:J domain-containing protein n=1 Tax=Rhododendron simsii TaxID=118357 RepID=A0A834GKH1_RHOSS|nr:hypothetical protein RHSIM_Rhsim08G0100500 [Rhododendron simsii]